MDCQRHSWRERGLRKRKSPGAPSRLSAEQLALLPKLLERGAEAYGFRGNLWTSRRIAKVIKTEFRVAYHPDHAGRIIRRVGWSVQKPVERASQRDEHAIEHWRKERWPQIKKRPKRKGESLCG